MWGKATTERLVDGETNQQRKQFKFIKVILK